MDMKPIIELRDLAYRYPDGSEALRAVSLEIERGERVAVLGNNGAGKSTLFLLLNGIYRAKSGVYLFDGQEVTYSKLALYELRSRVGVVFQEPDNQLFAPSVYEELSFGPLNLNLSVEEVKCRICEVMLMVDIEAIKNKPPQLLSYGQKKRVAIASVLTMKPEVLVLDEPLSGLDPAHSLALVKLFDDLHMAGTTVVLSTHDVDFALSWADKIVLMNNGVVEIVGYPDAVFSNRKLLQRCGLQMPTVLKLYETIAHKCVGKTPKNIDELNLLIGGL